MSILKVIFIKGGSFFREHFSLKWLTYILAFIASFGYSSIKGRSRKKVLKPEVKRAMVKDMNENFGRSVNKACQLCNISRSSNR